VKALALHDDEMLRIVERWLPLETNVGALSMADFRERYGILRYSATTDQFRQLAAVAATQDIALINAGYTAEVALIERLAQVDRTVKVERLDPSDLSTRFDTLEPSTELNLRAFKATAQRTMDRLGCEVVIRSFDPAGLSALYLIDREAEFRSELRATKDKSDDIWAGVLGALDSTVVDGRPQLVLNYRNPLVRRITVLPDAEIIGLAMEALYGQALLVGYHPIRPADAAVLNRSFLGLLDRAVPREDS
jgi:molecular chaperone HtpG